MSERRDYLTPTRALAILAGLTAVGFVATVLAVEWAERGLVSLLGR